MRRVVGIVLAAGESRRMGRLKALLPFGRGQSLSSVPGFAASELAAVVVVLGHRAADIAAVIQQLPVQLLHNPDYQHGMTTSVQVAQRDITPIPDAYLLALIDQPHLDQGAYSSF
jgi:molybdenum cofactor cytidylyltransferase